MSDVSHSTTGLSRRGFLGAASIGAAALTQAPRTIQGQEKSQERPQFRYCLNTSTIRGQRLPLEKIVDMAAEVGYDALEPWISDIQDYKGRGGDLGEMKKRIADHGMTVESAIGFANWIVDDEAKRAEGLENAKRDMELLAGIGGIRIAAPPAGATNQEGMDLFRVAERYHALLEVGRETGVVPQLELWGFSKTLSRLGEVAFVAAECGHPDACVLTDVYHVYKGGSDINGYRLFAGSMLSAIHLNDYPADPPRETIGDGDRVLPGDGIAPIGEILRIMASNGFNGPLSLEIFNRSYWEMDAKLVMKSGLEKMRAVVDGAFTA